MTTIESVVSKLKKNGERITLVTTSILNIFFKTRKPISTQEILKELSRKGRTINKTTVYRQIERLLKNKIIFEVRLEDRQVRYEIAKHEDHHHHLVCLRCGEIQDVRIPSDMETQEKEIYKKNKFKVERHSLEFFGLCSKCQ
jgi:Fe2+ or Zn2+ uptake regulation protein